MVSNAIELSCEHLFRLSNLCNRRNRQIANCPPLEEELVGETRVPPISCKALLCRVESKNNIHNVFFASIVDQVRFNSNLLVRLQEDIRSEFPNRVDVSAGACYVRRKHCLAVSDTLKDARRQ